MSKSTVWLGFDTRLGALRAKPHLRDEISSLRAALSHELSFGTGRPLAVGEPLIVGRDAAAAAHDVCRDFVRAVEGVAAIAAQDAELRSILDPSDLMAYDSGRGQGVRVDFCRVDTMPTPDGPVQILETNANCPGSLTSGAIARAFRRAFPEEFADCPPQPYESSAWFGEWLCAASGSAGFVSDSPVALLCPAGENDFELDIIADSLQLAGRVSFRADPRDVRRSGKHVFANGQRFEVAYMKIGMRWLSRSSSEVAALLRSIGDGVVWVQNNLRARVMADNKLILALLSDPRWGALVPISAELASAIPWSRFGRTLGRAEHARISNDGSEYVLKRPHDTRGNGVVIGQFVSEQQWEASVEVAVKENWLVQRYVPSCAPPVPGVRYHDLALSFASGALGGLHVRTSMNPIINVAQGGALHCAFYAN